MLSKDHAAVVAAASATSRPEMPRAASVKAKHEVQEVEPEVVNVDDLRKGLDRALGDLKHALAEAQVKDIHRKWGSVLAQTQEGAEDLVDALFLRSALNAGFLAQGVGHRLQKEAAEGLARWVIDACRPWTKKQRKFAHSLLAGARFVPGRGFEAFVQKHLNTAFPGQFPFAVSEAFDERSVPIDRPLDFWKRKVGDA